MLNTTSPRALTTASGVSITSDTDSNNGRLRPERKANRISLRCFSIMLCNILVLRVSSARNSPFIWSEKVNWNGSSISGKFIFSASAISFSGTASQKRPSLMPSPAEPRRFKVWSRAEASSRLSLIK
ncbi:hypothetical protein D3C75_1064040 [compost metagenome]